MRPWSQKSVLIPPRTILGKGLKMGGLNEPGGCVQDEPVSFLFENGAGGLFLDMDARAVNLPCFEVQHFFEVVLRTSTSVHLYSP